MGVRWLLALVGAWCLAVVTTSGPAPMVQPVLAAQAPAANAPATQAPPDTKQKPSAYVGSDTCLVCHSDMETTLKGTKHAQALDQRTPAARQGCESCHGPGQAHVDDDAKEHILKFAKASPAEASGACLNCHSGGAHAAWQGSKHEGRNLTCTTCHSVHHPVPRPSSW